MTLKTATRFFEVIATVAALALVIIEKIERR